MDVELKTEIPVDDEIVLRAWKESDVDSVLEAVLRNRDHLQPFMHWMTPDYNIESARKFITEGIANMQAKKNMGFGIYRGKDLIGTIGFVHFDWTSRKTEIGYWIDKDEEGKGIITRACRALIDYSFDELAMNRVEIRCSAENARSAAVPERLGFTQEGLLRQSDFRNGRFHDFKVYGLLANEPRLW